MYTWQLLPYSCLKVVRQDVFVKYESPVMAYFGNVSFIFGSDLEV